MKHSIKTGVSFGATSGIITTLGLMVGLHSGSNSKAVVLGGILTIAIADAFSDALGIHVAEEYENIHSEKEIWISTIATFVSKFFFALMFVVPVLLFDLLKAVIVSIIGGFLLLGVLSYRVGRKQKIGPWKVIWEHLLIALVGIAVTHYIGHWISSVFN